MGRERARDFFAFLSAATDESVEQCFELLLLSSSEEFKMRGRSSGGLEDKTNV